MRINQATSLLPTLGLPPGIKPFTLSTSDPTKPIPSSDLSDLWSVLSPFWALLSNEVAALNEKLNASLKSVIMEIKGEVVQDEMVPSVYKGLAENMAPDHDMWKVREGGREGREGRGGEGRREWGREGGREWGREGGRGGEGERDGREGGIQR